MSDFFMTTEQQASPGMYVHENTKNFRTMRTFEKNPAVNPVKSTQWLADIVKTVEGKIVLERKLKKDISTLNCLDTLLRRRSVRHYNGNSISKEALSDFLQLSYPSNFDTNNKDSNSTEKYTESHIENAPHSRVSNWNGHVSLCRLVLLINNVEGVDPGAYLYNEHAHELHKRKPASSKEITNLLRGNCFQKEFVQAPVMCMQIGSLKECVDRYGERGYRYMLLEDGVQIQRMYLAATSLSLACCATGSLIQGKLELWMDMDGYNASVLNAFVIGDLLDSRGT